MRQVMTMLNSTIFDCLIYKVRRSAVSTLTHIASSLRAINQILL
jgi:hypothetical protein